MGDQHELANYEDMVCYPMRIAMYEGEDGPLETAPDPGRQTANAVDFIKAGRPGMVVGKVGKKE